jgi:hypothetical protein
MRLPSWIIVAAVGTLVVLAAADALRPSAHNAPRAAVEPTTTRAKTPGLAGAIVVGSDCSSVRALRLPDMIVLQAPRQTDCDGFVWSQDGTLYAQCGDGRTDVGTSEGRLVYTVEGCAPAWREDGALGVIRRGELVVARTHGRPVVLLSRPALAHALAGWVARPRTYKLAEVAWIGSGGFAAIVHGARPWEEALLVMSNQGEIATVTTEYGSGISDLRVSPHGWYLAFAKTRLGRELTMMAPDGTTLPLPQIGNALNIAWSPDDSHVAISTRTTTFVAETGSPRTQLQVPRGGRYLAWIP